MNRPVDVREKSLLQRHQARGSSYITCTNNASNHKTSTLPQTRLNGLQQTLRLLIINLGKVSRLRHLSQQPLKVQDITIAPTIDHRHGPQQQQIRLRRKSTAVHWCRLVDSFDGPLSDLEEVDVDPETLGGIERNHAVGFAREVEGAVRHSRLDILNGLRRRGNIYVLGFLGRGVGNARSTADEDCMAAEWLSD